MNLWDSIRNVVKLGKTTGVQESKDTDQFYVIQAQYMNKTALVQVAFPYGMFAKLPADQLITILSVAAEEAHRVALGTGNTSDAPDIAEGELVYYHPTTQSKIHFKNNGEIEVTTESGDINVIPGGSSIVNLGDGGENIVRDTDNATITIPAGSSAGVYTVSFNTAGDNKST